MKISKTVLSILIFILFTTVLLVSASYCQSYTGIIINTEGRGGRSYAGIKIIDRSNKYIQATYILDTKINKFEQADLYQVYDIAGNNPLILNGKIRNDEVILTRELDDTNKPIILIM